MRKRGPPPKIPTRLHDDVCWMLLVGVPTTVVARALGVCNETINIVVRRQVPGRRRRPKLLSDQDADDICRRILAGERPNALAEEYRNRNLYDPRFSYQVGNVVGPMPKASQRPRSDLRLSLQEREEISRGVQAFEPARSIARRLNRAPSTITREIRRCGGRWRYRAWLAESRFRNKCPRPKVAKLASKSELRAEVELGLMNFWSPEQISAELRRRFPDDRSMQVSHETIYQSLYVQGRGALRAELKQYLRWKRMGRRKRGNSQNTRGKIRDMVLISDRPAEAADRAVPGHWEGDLIIGRNGKSAVATLVERKSRYVMLAALPNGRTAEEVKDALVPLVQRLPEQLRRSLTWDQGKEMAQHVAFTVATGVQVYFCDPHSPWQRGSNENTNGLLRQFLPRTADLSVRSQAELDEIARLLNQRPRQTLNWLKPCEVLNVAVVASTG
jgi:transposase, IS30 family